MDKGWKDDKVDFYAILSNLTAVESGFAFFFSLYEQTQSMVMVVLMVSLCCNTARLTAKFCQAFIISGDFK
jgi:hypothetical protein